MIAIVAVFLAAAGFSTNAVKRHGDFSRKFTQTREQSQLTSDIRALLYQHLAAAGGVFELPQELAEETWPDFVLEDIDVQIRLAQSDEEREHWTHLRAGIVDLNRAEQYGDAQGVNAAVHDCELHLREIRNHYDVIQYDMGAYSATSSFVEFAAMCAACATTTVLFLLYLAMVRKWLVKPIETLRASTETIGKGDLTHRVPLEGKDELADLARGIDAMTEGLAQHQAALVEARELSVVGELCANIAHGLRNPLAAIRATAQLAERRLNGNPEAALMRELTGQTDRMDRRITKLFEFSRRVAIQKTPTTFAALAAAVNSHMEGLLSARNISLETRDEAGDFCVDMDTDQISEAVAELVANAIHHSPEGATVELYGVHHQNGGGVQSLAVTVRDHGVGMEESTLSKAFDPFFTSRSNGIGMGLTLVRRIAERHGGQLEIKTAPGEGVSATIDLPATRQNGSHE